MKSTVVSAPSIDDIDPKSNPTLFLAAVDGYVAQFLGKNGKQKSIDAYRRVILRLGAKYGPVWTSEQIDHETQERVEQGISLATRRFEHVVIQQFTQYLLNPNYAWKQRFAEVYHQFPIEPLYHANRIMHIEAEESESNVRPTSWAEYRAFVDRCKFNARNAFSKRARRAALRDGSMFQTGAGFGLRDLEMSDCRLSGLAPAGDRVTFGNYGSLRIHGKSKRYGPARPRTIYAIGLYPWTSKILDHHVQHIMPLFSRGDGDHLFTSEKGDVLDPAYISEIFCDIRDDAGLPKACTAHGMRRMWATTCAIAGVDGWYISDQMGHESFEMTMRYIHIPEDFMQRTVLRHQQMVLTE